MNSSFFRKYPVLYSAGTRLAYSVDNEFYSRKHFVWCTIHFHSPIQAPSSDPSTIISRFLGQVVSGDRHDIFVKSNATGILRGAKAHFQKGDITNKQFNDIRAIVKYAELKHFLPVLYIIDTKKVANRAIIVPNSSKASNSSIEILIEDLNDNEFEIIDLSELLNGFIQPHEGRLMDL